MGSDIETLLREGIDDARRGERASARIKFERVVELDDRNEKGWFWLASVLDTDQERHAALDKVLPIYKHWKQASDLAPERLATIQHFFEHYKDLEPGKWVKVTGWGGPEEAAREILDGIAHYKQAKEKPHF